MGNFNLKFSMKSVNQLVSNRILLFHSVSVIISAVNVYAFLYNLTLVEIGAGLTELLDKHIRVNPWKYMTFWNMVLQLGYFSLALLTDVMGLDVTLKNNQRRLEHIRDITFASWLLPVGTWVFTSFWGLYWKYPHLILPDKMAMLLPFWVNHGTHTMPAIFSVAELCLVRHKYPNRHKGIQNNLAIYVVYLIYMGTSSLNTGVWPYPILTELPHTHLAVIVSSLLVSAITQYVIGEQANNLIWGTKWTSRKQSIKRSDTEGRKKL